jgi:NifU-like protein involved in Fe-S cluster formation
MPASPATPAPKLDARIRRPRTRGAFMPIDAARRQLGLLSVADSQGQCRIYWLVDLTTTIIEDSRFLAFGALESHAVADAFTESVRGRTVEDACRLTAEQVEAVLREDPITPAVTPERLAFLSEIQDAALAELPNLRLLPKPAEKVAYQRKRKADWTPEDEAWLPLSLLKKTATVEDVVAPLVRERLGAAAKHSIEGLHDDLRVVIAFSGVPDEQLPTIGKLLEDVLRGRVHSQMRVEAVGKG